MEKYVYDTVSQAVNDLIKRGYTADFNITQEDTLYCSKTNKSLSPEEFKIDELYRFDGDTNPDDEMIVYAISSEIKDVKGILINAYGTYADTKVYRVIKYLSTHS